MCAPQFMQLLPLGLMSCALPVAALWLRFHVLWLQVVLSGLRLWPAYWHLTTRLVGIYMTLCCVSSLVIAWPLRMLDLALFAFLWGKEQWGICLLWGMEQSAAPALADCHFVLRGCCCSCISVSLYLPLSMQTLIPVAAAQM
jgi:hypothetical protein